MFCDILRKKKAKIEVSSFSEMLSTMSSRSTKGASKQRRENINSEIGIIRDLLPIQEQVRSRLSQLQIMSLCKAYIGKSNLLNSMQDSKIEDIHPFDFTQAISGFLLITDMKGRIFYVSDNVTDYLAHSMVDVITQAETVYELVHTSDQQVFRTIYSFGDQSSPVEDSTFAFTCRMGMLKHPRRNPNFDRYKKMRIFGRKVIANDPMKRAYFVALCTPRLNPMMASDPSFVFDTMIFKSVHAMDMKFVSIDHNGEHHLGYTEKELSARSWYEMIHPDDIDTAVSKHKELAQQIALEASCSLSLRVQSKGGDMLCLQVIMKKEYSLDSNAEARIVCWNQVVCPNEMGADDKEDLLHQMSTINYLDQYCSSQSSDKRILFASNGSAVGAGAGAKEKKCDRSELMEKLKRKMQRPDAEKSKMVKIGGVKSPAEKAGVEMKFNSAASLDILGLLSSERASDHNGNIGFASQYDLTNLGLGAGSSIAAAPSPLSAADQRSLYASPSALDGFPQATDKAAEGSLGCFIFPPTGREILTMPSPERQNAWSPSPSGNYCLATSPGSEDLNNQSFFPINMGVREPKQEAVLRSSCYSSSPLEERQRSSFPELKPHEVDEFFEMEAHFMTDMGGFEQMTTMDGGTFTEQFTQNLLQHLSAMAY